MLSLKACVIEKAVATEDCKEGPSTPVGVL